jgi:hypothetical protein
MSTLIFLSDTFLGVDQSLTVPRTLLAVKIMYVCCGCTLMNIRYVGVSTQQQEVKHVWLLQLRPTHLAC